MTTIKVQFHWAVYRPDARQYKQQSLEVNPFLEGGNQPLVEIELPIELLANHDEFLAKSKEPILSVAAVKYLVDEWEKVFSDVSPDDFKLETTTSRISAIDDWGEEEDDPSVTDYEKANPVTEPEDNWDDVATTEEPIPWNEKDEDWGTEPNLDN